MRSHKQIVQAYGAAALARGLAEHGLKVGPSTPQRWADRDSIPSEYWMTLVEMGAASLSELAKAASVRPVPAAVEERSRKFQGPEVKKPLIYPPLARTEEERQAAIESLLGMAGQGYSSNGWKFNRDELYDRESDREDL